MATVKIDRFGGIAPRQHPTQLSDGMAVVAHNLRLKTGKLVPLKGPRLVAGANVLLESGLTDVSDARSLHVWRRRDGDFDFLLFKGVTWAAPGNVSDDDLTRLIVSGDRDGDGIDEGPVVYMRRGASAVKTVVPLAKEPLSAPRVQRNAGQGDVTENIRYTRFFVSWVDVNGMESPFSEPSRIYDSGVSEWTDGDLEYNDGDAVTVSGFGAKTDYPLAKKIRVYKVVTGATTGRSQFVAEADATLDSTWTDGIGVKVKDEDAGEIMPDVGAPPADLSCILDVPGAFYCGFSPSKPKTVCFSDVDLFYSWPVAYRYDVRDNVVALAVTANSVFALTDGWPYVLSGTAPESMTVSKLAGPAACVSKRGVCVYRNAVYYASNAGLMVIANSADEGTVCQNVTDKIFTKEQWLAYNPSSCVMNQHDGALFLFFTLPDGSHRGLTIDLLENAAVAVTTHDEAAACLCVDDREDRMYYVREGV